MSVSTACSVVVRTLLVPVPNLGIRISWNQQGLPVQWHRHQSADLQDLEAPQYFIRGSAGVNPLEPCGCRLILAEKPNPKNHTEAQVVKVMFWAHSLHAPVYLESQAAQGNGPLYLKVARVGKKVARTYEPLGVCVLYYIACCFCSHALGASSGFATLDILGSPTWRPGALIIYLVRVHVNQKYLGQLYFRNLYPVEKYTY